MPLKQIVKNGLGVGAGEMEVVLEEGRLGRMNFLQ